MSGLDRVEVGFVVPAYNAAGTVGETVQCLLAQDLPSWEAVVVDDGSADGTLETALAAAGGDPRVRGVRRENGGPSAARNLGLGLIGARAVCFLDADDVVEPMYVRVMLGALRGGAGCDAVACSYRFDGGDAAGGIDGVQRAAVGQYTEAGLREGIFAPMGARLFDCAVLARLGAAGARLFREDLRRCEDWEMLARVSRTGARWGVVEEPLLRYRRHAGSLSSCVGPVWRDGREVVRSLGWGAAVLRRWDLRCLAASLVQGSAEETEEIRDACGGVAFGDLDTLTGALRWAVAASGRCGMETWRGRAAASLGPVGGALVERVGPSAGGLCWSEVVSRAAERVGAGETLVIYGLGRNGRAAVAAAQSLRLAVSAVDDDAGVVCGVPRLRAEELGARHVVLVTPDERSVILAKLEALGVKRVVVAETA